MYDAKVGHLCMLRRFIQSQCIFYSLQNSYIWNRIESVDWMIISLSNDDIEVRIVMNSILSHVVSVVLSWISRCHLKERELSIEWRRYRTLGMLRVPSLARETFSGWVSLPWMEKWKGERREWSHKESGSPLLTDVEIGITCLHVLFSTSILEERRNRERGRGALPWTCDARW